MESEERENVEQNLDDLTVDLSKRSLKKIERANNEQNTAESLILDCNELQRLDNLDSYKKLKRLSLANNRLIRMEGISCMISLTVLDISSNSLVCIEGLKDLKQLKHLNLACNKIKTIDHLNYNLNLEYLDLSHNIIGHISDISFLQNLKELFLHNNEIAHLRQCEKNLPTSLETLTLNNNYVTDLNEISHLVMLQSLKELSFNNNPCLEFTDTRIDFNYRPYVKNWCSSILILDGYPLDDIECLKAEWLYSQGRGRSFRPGEQIALAKYLTSVCPRTTEPNAESEDEKKLRLILSKAQHHQQQLKEQLKSSSPLPNRHKLPLNKKKSSVIPERMVSSCHDNVSKESGIRNLPDLMTQSLDGVLLRNSQTPQNNLPESYRNPLQTATTLLPVPESLTSPDVCRSLSQFPTPSSNTKMNFPLTSSYPCKSPLPSSRNSPFSTPEGKVKNGNVLRKQNNHCSPVSARKCDKVSNPGKNRLAFIKEAIVKKNITHVSPVPARKQISNGKENSEDETEFSDVKSENFSNQKNSKKHILDSDGKENFENMFGNDGKDNKESDMWKAALCIQRHWRGYRIRNLNQEVVGAFRNIQTNRIQDYIVKVANDVEATRVALEGHRRLQVLQMQAINALWKKMVNLQNAEGAISTDENKNTLQGLAQTCINLNKQVEELHSMMKIMHHHSSHCQSIPTATQTEIIAVHTPQGENQKVFPYYNHTQRPAGLSVSETMEQSGANFKSAKVVSSTSDSGECETEPHDNNHVKDKEESICLTPACQEGKDLQLLAVGDASVQADESHPDEEKEDCSSQLRNSGVEGQSSGDQEYQRNGCPSS